MQIVDVEFPEQQWNTDKRREILYRVKSLSHLPDTNYLELICYTQQENSTVSDSDDGDVPVEKCIPPVLEDLTMKMFKKQHQELYHYFNLAKKFNMTNAYGDFFIHRLYSLVLEN